MATKKTGSVNSRLAEVLVKLQDRLGRVAHEAAIAVEALEERTIALGYDAERESKLNLSRAQLAAKENADTKKTMIDGWAKIHQDFDAMMKLNQKLNERVSQLESRLSAVSENAHEALTFKNNLRAIVNQVTSPASIESLRGAEQGVSSSWKQTGTDCSQL
jgi:hypothetical protein